jgi:hypothetical protein
METAEQIFSPAFFRKVKSHLDSLAGDWGVKLPESVLDALTQLVAETFTRSKCA